MSERKGLDAFSLEGRTAVVTGARTGIGQAIALGLAEAGARLVLWGHEKNFGETEDILKKSGGLLRTVDADLVHVREKQFGSCLGAGIAVRLQSCSRGAALKCLDG